MARRRATGRPSLLRTDPRIAEAIVEAVEAGVPVGAAARAAGIPKQTVSAWLARGSREQRGPFRDFADSVARARARATARNLVELRRAARGGQILQRLTETIEHENGSVTTKTTERWTAPDWRANAWWLERQFPEEFAKVERHEVSGPDGGPIFLAIGELYRQDPEARAAGLVIAQRAIESGMLDGKPG